MQPLVLATADLTPQTAIHSLESAERSIPKRRTPLEVHPSAERDEDCPRQRKQNPKEAVSHSSAATRRSRRLRANSCWALFTADFLAFWPEACLFKTSCKVFPVRRYTSMNNRSKDRTRQM